MMGTTTIRPRGPILNSQSLPSDVNSLLERIRTHPSHGSAGYYFKNLTQYFEDALRSLTELRRVLRPGAQAIIIVQDSYYKEIRINLPRLYVCMAKETGFTATIAREFEVSQAFTRLNRRAKKHRKRHEYRESAVLLVSS